jgi:hypothetical protein
MTSHPDLKSAQSADGGRLRRPPSVVTISQQAEEMMSGARLQGQAISYKERDHEQSTRQLEEAGGRERAWQIERRRDNFELELDLDRTPAGRSVSDVDQVAATVDTPDVAAPDPSCGFERVFGPDWRTRYPAIAGGVDKARRQRTSPTAPADDPRRSGPPPGAQGSAFENRSSGDGWSDNPHRGDAPSRRTTVVSRRKTRNPGGASVDPRLPKLSGRAK